MIYLFFYLLIFIVIAVAICIGGYYLAIQIIKIWTGCDNDGASTKIHNFFSGKAHCQLNSDVSFVNEVWGNVHNIIGEKRFQQLVQLSNTMIDTPLLFFDDNGKIPSINISMYFSDENEQRIIENIIVNVVKKHLRIYGYCTEFFCKWSVRYDLNMPLLQILYAKNEEQKATLRLYLASEKSRFIEQNSDLLDETEEEDLFE